MNDNDNDIKLPPLPPAQQEAPEKDHETHENTNKAMTDAPLMMEEREQRDEALLRQALDGIELHLRHHECGCVFLDEIVLALRERLRRDADKESK